MNRTPQRLRSRKTPRQKRSTETRERILDAAARVFTEHGYAAGTTNRIADEAGLSIGSLYQYFPNKDALLLELARRHIEHGRQTATAAITRGLPATWPERIAVLVDAALQAHAGDHRLHQVIFEESPRPPTLLTELHALQDSVIDFLADLLHQNPEQNQPDSRPPRLVAWFLAATTESLVHRYLADQPTDQETFRHELIALLTGYITSTQYEEEDILSDGSVEACVSSA